MLYFKKFATMLLLALSTVWCTSCSHDDELAANEPTRAFKIVNPTNVYPCGVPSKVGRYEIELDASGHVSRITEGRNTFTFEYSGSNDGVAEEDTDVPINYDMVMRCDMEYPSEDITYYLVLNDNGFVEYAYGVKVDEEPLERWFTYNEDDQLSTTKQSNSYKPTKELVYENGNIRYVKSYGYGKLLATYTISYLDALTSPYLANPTGITLYSQVYGLDFGDFHSAIYAGLLGKGTRNLPRWSKVENTNSNSQDYTFVWVFNPDEMPVEFLRNFTVDDETYSTKTAIEWNRN